MNAPDNEAPRVPTRGAGDDSALVIRQAHPGDATALYAMVCELARFEHLEAQLSATPETLSQALFGEKPAAEALIAERAGEPLGYAIFFSSFSTFLAKPGIYLEDLFVMPAARGLGLGKLLLRAVAKIAVERGAGRFEWSVLDWNERAIGFYRQAGAEILPNWRICRVTGSALNALAKSDSPAER
jgi:GNAT superfamily N-acetyltransferase